MAGTNDFLIKLRLELAGIAGINEQLKSIGQGVGPRGGRTSSGPVSKATVSEAGSDLGRILGKSSATLAAARDAGVLTETQHNKAMRELTAAVNKRAQQLSKAYGTPVAPTGVQKAFDSQARVETRNLNQARAADAAEAKKASKESAEAAKETAKADRATAAAAAKEARARQAAADRAAKTQAGERAEFFAGSKLASGKIAKDAADKAARAATQKAKDADRAASTQAGERAEFFAGSKQARQDLAKAAAAREAARAVEARKAAKTQAGERADFFGGSKQAREDLAKASAKAARAPSSDTGELIRQATAKQRSINAGERETLAHPEFADYANEQGIGKGLRRLYTEIISAGNSFAELNNTAQDLAAQRRTLSHRLRAASPSSVQADADEQLALKEAKRARSANIAARPEYQGTLFQRLQQSLSRRDPNGPVRAATDFQTGKQLIGSKLLTTASFAASGGLLFGAISGMKTVIEESTQLDQELAIIKTQFESVDETANGITFAKFRGEMLETAKAAGVQADQVANVERQLAGAFASDAGVPNFKKAGAEGDVAIRFAKLTGLPQQEITDSLTAISLAFDNLPFKRVADLTLDLENRFGVLAPQLVTFTADLAPLASELGFTAEQLASLGAVAQQASGQSGGVISSQFAKILPAIQGHKSDLIDLFASNQGTAAAADPLIEAFSRNDIPAVLKLMVQNYANLGKEQRNVLASLVGGRREAGAFYALLERGNLTVNALDSKAGTGSGAFEKRWDSYSKTVTLNLDRMRRSAEEFGLAVFESGIGDGLTTAAKAAKELADAGVVLLRVVGGINTALGGIPGKVAVAIAAFKLLRFGVGKGAQALGTQGLAGQISGGSLTALGTGAFSPFRPDASGNLALRGSYRRAENSFIGGRLPREYAAGPAYGNKAELAAVRAAGLPGSVEGEAARVGSLKGGLKSTAAAIGADAAVAVAVAAVVGLVAETQKVQDDVAKAKEALRDRIEAALDKGVSEARVREQTQTGHDSLIGRALVNFGKFGPVPGGFLLGTGTAKDLLTPGAQSAKERERAITAHQSQRSNAQLAGVKDTDLQALAALGAKPDQQATRLTDRYGNLQTPKTNAQATDQARQAAITRDRKIIQDAKDDPGSKEKQKRANALIARLKANSIAVNGMDEALRKLDADDKATNNATARAPKFVAYEASAATASADYAEGRGSLQAVLKPLNNTVRLRREALKDAQKQGEGIEVATEELRQAVAAARKPIEDTIAATAVAANTRGEYANAGAVGQLKVAQTKLKSLTDAGADIPTQIAALGEVRAAEKAVLEEKLAQADTNAERIKILDDERKKPISGVARTLLIADQLTRGDDNTLAVVDIAAALFDGNVDKARDFVIENIDKYGEFNRKALNKMLDAEAETIKRILKYGGSDLDPVDRGNLLTQLDAILGARGTPVHVDDPGAKGRKGQKTPEQIAGEKQEADTNRETAAATRTRLAQVAATHGDELAPVRAAVANAKANLDHIKTAGAERNAAYEALQQALADQDAAIVEVSHANALGRFAYRKAQAALDPTELANIAVQEASYMLSIAKTDGEKWTAMAAGVDAQRQVGDAIAAAFTAQRGVIQAILEAAGDTVGAAENQLGTLIGEFNLLKAQGASKTVLDQKSAQIIAQQASAANTRNQDRISDLDYLYEFDQITAQELIKGLQAVLAITQGKKARQDLSTKIKGIRDAMNADLQFDIPDIKLPLLYEARRLQGYGGKGYQADRGVQNTAPVVTDNRRIFINVSADDQAQMDAAMRQVIDTVEAPTRSGYTPGVYP